MEVGKVTIRGEGLFFFCCSLLKKKLFWVYQKGNFLPEKAFHAGKNIRKNNFAPSEKYACYAPGRDVCQKDMLPEEEEAEERNGKTTRVCSFAGRLISLAFNIFCMLAKKLLKKRVLFNQKMSWNYIAKRECFHLGRHMPTQTIEGQDRE